MNPDLVAPMVAYLAHEACTVSGEFYVAGGGRFGRIFVAANDGYLAPDPASATIDTVAEHWSTIDDPSDFYIPTSLHHWAGRFFAHKPLAHSHPDGPGASASACPTASPTRTCRRISGWWPNGRPIRGAASEPIRGSAGPPLFYGGGRAQQHFGRLNRRVPCSRAPSPAFSTEEYRPFDDHVWSLASGSGRRCSPSWFCDSSQPAHDHSRCQPFSFSAIPCSRGRSGVERNDRAWAGYSESSMGVTGHHRVFPTVPAGSFCWFSSTYRQRGQVPGRRGVVATDGVRAVA